MSSPKPHIKLDAMAMADSKTFCVYPWVEQVVQSNGKMSFCCVGHKGGIVHKGGGQDYTAAEDRLADAWNSPYMRGIRKAMLEGEKVDACKLCYFQESIGKRSYRQMHNEEWSEKAGAEIRRRISHSRENGFVVDGPPLYLDLRLGNLCNLKCRSCNPNNSSQIFRENQQLLAEDETYRGIWKRHHGGAPQATQPWFEDDGFWDEVIASIPRLRKVYLTGGEPTLIEKNYKFLKACVDSGHAKNIFLMFNTNCTNVQERFLEYLPHFQFVLINASIDAFGSENDYIRHLSRWESIDANFRKLLGTKGNVQIGVTPVVQIYNILSITGLLDYIDETSVAFGKAINVDFLYATSPAYIDPAILPARVKELAAERLESFKRRSHTYGKEPFLTNSVDSCINLMRESSDRFSPELLADFAAYTDSLDRKRRQRFADRLPELHDLLRDEGVIADREPSRAETTKGLAP